MADITPVPGFFDGLGDRVVVHDRSIGALEVLRLRSELTSDAAFEPALRARLLELASVRHPGLGRSRHVGRLASPDLRLAIVSDLAEGLRLSEVLQAIEQLNLPLHTNAALFLLRQLVAAVACLHAAGPEVSHGALGPERLVISPTGRLVVVEHVLGRALAHLPHTQPARVWKDLRLVIAADEQPPFGRRTDMLQVGLCGLALVRSRALRVEECPVQAASLLDPATESTITGDRRPLRPPLRGWLERAIAAGTGQGDAWTLDEAREALDAMLAADGYLATPTGLASLLEQVRRYLQGSDLETAKQDHEDAAPTGVARAAAASVAGNTASPSPGLDDARTGPPWNVTTAAPPPAGPASGEPAPAVTAPSTPAPASSGLHAGTGEASPAALSATVAPKVSASAGLDAAHGEASPPAPFGAPHLRLVSPVVAPAWASSVTKARGVESARTEGALAMAPALPAPAESPDDNFAPEAGVSFPPDEPEPEPKVAPPPLPAPLRPASGATLAVAALSTASSPASGAVPAAPIAEPVAEPMAEPIAAALARESLADLVHTRPGRGEGSAGHRASSGPARASHAMFDTAEEERPFAARKVGLSLPLKLAAAGVILIVLAVPSWLLFGRGGDGSEKAVPPRGAHPAAVVPAAAPAAAPVESAAPREPAGSELLPSSLAGAAAAAEAAGSLQFETPFQLEVFEDGVKLGTTDAPIVLAAGRHALDIANAEYAFRGRQVVDIRPGRPTRVPAKLPTGLANVNATPWAEVWIDGVRAGETPLGNLSLTIGPHEAVFRHPQL
ncbi:MAG: hypothetical protein H6Q10_2076, partial [Acidobacteria bacterium]|nr:hypothetical protein [Acidobacteriota bacterium]